MAYDLDLAKRIRALIGNAPDLVEKPMFGGLAFLANGNMAIAASSKGGVLLRVEPAQTMALAKKPHARPMEMRGRPMEGWLRVDSAGVATDKGLRPWVDLSVAFARSLPAKDAAKKSGMARKKTGTAVGKTTRAKAAKPAKAGAQPGAKPKSAKAAKGAARKRR